MEMIDWPAVSPTACARSFPRWATVSHRLAPAAPQHNSHRLDVSLRRDFLDCPSCSTRVADRVLGADEAFFWCSSDYLTTASSNNVDSDGAAAACCVLLVIVLRLPLL